MKVIKIGVVIMMMFLVVPAFAFDKWDKTDMSLLAVGTVAQIIDWRQTRRIAEQPDRFHEVNPALGRHPSTDRVDMYFAASLVIKAGIAHVLPSKWRKVWLGTMAVGSIGLVAHNANIGLGISW
jgi:hypothetical protein